MRGGKALLGVPAADEVGVVLLLLLSEEDCLGGKGGGFAPLISPPFTQDLADSARGS